VRFDFQPYFNRFIGDILVLDQTREERIREAFSHLARLVQSDSALRRYRPDLVLQGSYAAGMAVRPARDRDEFDVDAVLKLDLPRSWSAMDALDFVDARLAEDAVFRERLVEHSRCVRLRYANQFHVDVVPARRVRTVNPASGATVLRLKVPGGSGWRFSNPEGFLRWCERMNTRTGGDLQRMALLLKRWRDLQVGEKRRVRSVVFTTLLGRAVPRLAGRGPSQRPDADVLVATLARLDGALRGLTRPPFVRNPSLSSENLARTWTTVEFLLFRRHVREALRIARHARQGSPEAWQMLFGQGFPVSR
jgi:hypothetical protein